MHKIRSVLGTEQGELLRGIFEMDEAYLKNNKSKKDDDDNHKGGHSNKTHTPDYFDYKINTSILNSIAHLGSALNHASPLAFDLDGDGIETVHQSDGVFLI